MNKKKLDNFNTLVEILLIQISKESKEFIFYSSVFRQQAFWSYLLNSYKAKMLSDSKAIVQTTNQM
jgi:hypothetical protein